jgi:hypothetical protein
VSPAPGARIVLSDAIYPAGRSALLFQAPDDQRLRAISWDGGTSGLLNANAARPTRPWSQSPDGSRYVIDGVVFDRLDRNLGALPWGEFAWSTDGQFACDAAHPPPIEGGPMRLETAVPGQPPRLVASGYETYHDNAGYPVLACDAQTDRAIVGSFGQGLFAGHLWIFKLSTGSIVRAVDLGQGAAGSWVTASTDGRMIAESVRPAAGTSTTTTVRRADDGAVLATVADFEARGFSGDGTLLVGQRGPSNRTTEILEWRTGRVVWTATGYNYSSFLAEPGGSHIAVAESLNDSIADQDVYIVASDGTSVLLPKGPRVSFR